MTSGETTTNHTEVLLKLPIPNLIPEQLKLITLESLRAQKPEPFSVQNTADRLAQANGKYVWAVDIGGTGIKANRAQIVGGEVVFDKNGLLIPVEGDNEKKGENYINALFRLRDEIGDECTPVGISTAGIVSSGILLDSANIPGFMRDLKKLGGFEKIFGKRVSVYNDAVAGLIAAIMGVEAKGLSFENIIYLINGGGIGGAVFKNDGLIALEPGHVKAINELNPFKMQRPCMQMGQQFTCLERLGSIGNIEKIWQEIMGSQKSGKEIAELMYSGDKTAQQLLGNSATIFAHEIEGISQTLGLMSETTVAIAHGGGFKTEGMIDRIGQILTNHHGSDTFKMVIKKTEDIGITDNACLTGAAIAAATMKM